MANPVTINPTLTLAGQAAAFNASGDGLELKITHVSFGRAHYDPTGNEIALASPVGSKIVLAGASRPTPYQIRTTCSWREDVGEVPIGEIGFWAGNTLVFVWSKANGQIASYKTDGVAYVLFNDLAFASVPANSISFVVDPGESVALAALSEHEGANNAHPQYMLRQDMAKDAGPLAWLGVAGGTANVLTLALEAPEAVLLAYAAGQVFQFKASGDNTSAVTANIEGIGPKTIKKTGDAGLVDLEPGDIKGGAVYDLKYDGTYFQLGGGVGAGKAFQRFSFTASVAQNIFVCAHVVGSLIVLRNGREITDFTSDGAQVVLGVACNINDSVQILAFQPFKVSSAYTKAETLALMQTASALPVGFMMPNPTGVIPPGYLEVDGSVQSIAVYPDLAAYLGTKFNLGNEGAGNFRLPESRGEFLRGWDHGRSVDAGRAIGSYQLDALQNISGGIDGYLNIQSAGGVFAPTNYATTNTPSPAAGITGYHGVNFDASRMARTSTETRGRNLAVMWCIKAWNSPVNQGSIDISALAQKVIGNEFGRLLNIQKFTANGIYIPTVGMKKVRLRQIGGGSGSSGCPATTSAQTAASGGGSTGSYAESWLTAEDIGVSQVVTIGAAGAAGTAGGIGGAGGTTSLGGLVISPGGSAPSAVTAVGTAAIGMFGGGVPGAISTGGNLLNIAGVSGSPSILVNGSTMAGIGGSCLLGSGGYPSGSVPNPGSGYGSGAGGMSSGVSSAAKVGAMGGQGVMFLEEYM